MANETATTVPRRPGRFKRWLRRGLLALLVLVVLAAVVGACYQALGNMADARRFPQQGKSVSLGPALFKFDSKYRLPGPRQSHSCFG